MPDFVVLIGLPDEAIHSAEPALKAAGLHPRHTPADGWAVFAAASPLLEAAGDGVSLGARGRHRAVAVATLAYRPDLASRVRAAGAAPPALTERDAGWIAAAFDALGADAVAALEGEFAAVVMESPGSRVTACSDESGRRPLFFAEWRGGLALATATALLRRLPGLAVAPDLELLAERAAALVLSARRTAWQAIGRLGAGDRLCWAPGSSVRVERVRSYACFAGGDRRPSDEAASELARLLEAATAERLAPSGRSLVWMSGGYDSPAVFASGRAALEGGLAGRTIAPLSISFPEGSPGREDEMIAEIASASATPVHWVRLAAPEALADRLFGSLADRDDPFAHTYGFVTETLAEETRALDSVVALDGYGGDAVFYAGLDHYLADLVRAGRLRLAWQEWLAIGGRGRRGFVRYGVLPLLPDRLERWVAARLRVAPFRPFARALPDWLTARAATLPRLQQGLGDGGVPRAPGESGDAYAIRWMLESPLFQQVLGALRRITLRAGVSQRSPMLDRRVVDFMARRPRADRGAMGDTKLLLRAAMAGRLPAAAVARRAKRTGVPSDVLEATVARASRILLARDGMALADLGLVDADRLRRAVEAAEGRGVRGTDVLAAIQTEHWLRRTL